MICPFRFLGILMGLLLMVLKEMFFGIVVIGFLA
jgi:hypothetical protein